MSHTYKSVVKSRNKEIVRKKRDLEAKDHYEESEEKETKRVN